MANFIGLVYATLKAEGIDTAGMSTDEAVAKYNELQKEGGGKAGEKEGTPAENRKLEEKGYTFKKNTKNGDQIVNKYQQDGETHIIAKAEDGSFVVGYNYNEDKGTFENSAKFGSMKEAEQAFRKNNPNARLTEQNLSKGKKPSLVDTGKIDKTISKLEEGQKSKADIKKKQLEIIQKHNPMTDDYHQGIRSVDDIKTFDEVIDDDESFVWGDFEREDAEKALKSGKITIYSSYPIGQGTFVSTSKTQAEEYAGGRGSKVYSKEVPLSKVAWINGDEGQFADVD